MIFMVVSITVPLMLLIGLPYILRTTAYRWLLGAACLVFTVSWWLPSPLIYGQQTEFMTHFFGGGLFCGLLGLYIKMTQRLQWRWYKELIALFALVSMLGVLNELFEVVLWVLGYMPHGITDTSWDLVANTSGALVCYGGYVLGREYAILRRRH
jgi:hypothetical protein